MTSPLHSVPIVLNLIVIQLLGAYLRYLPFRQRMTATEIQTLWTRFFAVSALLFVLDMFIFHYYRISPFFYKMTFVFALIGYFLTAVFTIKEKFLYHIFVFGLQTIWALILHMLAATANSFCKVFFDINEIFLQGILFCFFFVLFWKLERNFFSKLLNNKYVLDKYFKWYDALLPLIIFIGLFIRIMNDVLIQSPLERTLRLFIPVFFFTIYHSMNIIYRQSENTRKQRISNKILQAQLQNLRNYNLIIQENQKQIAVLRHDLRHNYRLITAMLKAGKVQKAVEFLQTQTQKVTSNKSENQSMLQFVISTYRNKAQELKIKTVIEIQTSSIISFYESDLAILLSNLFDNAITASKNQPPNEREIILKLYQTEDKNFLEISNRVNFNFDINGDEIPFRKRGTGVNALLNFKKLYNAQIKFTQFESFLKISVIFFNSI